MKKEILITGIIFLFVGVGIQPAFAVDISNVRPSRNIEDCNCKVNDNYDIKRIERLLDRVERSLNWVETLTKLIPILSKDNPEAIKVGEELSVKIRPLKEMNEEFNSDSAYLDDVDICDILLKLNWVLSNFSNYLVSLMLKSVIMNLLLMPLLITETILEFSVFFLYAIICLQPPY